jgi:hypothetical protein
VMWSISTRMQPAEKGSIANLGGTWCCASEPAFLLYASRRACASLVSASAHKFMS